MDAVIVTGAAGALGHAVVDEFLGQGRAVVALDRPSPPLDALGERDDVHAVAADLAARDPKNPGRTGEIGERLAKAVS